VAQKRIFGVVLNYPTEQVRRGPLKLIQLNIWQGKILIAIKNFLKEQDADFVCLQEVFSSQNHIGVLDMLDSFEQLHKTLGYPHTFYSPTFAFNVNGYKATIGNAIFSKFPLENQRTIFTHQRYHEVSDWSEHLENTRNVQLADINIKGQTLTLVNHHGYREIDPLGSDRSITSMEKLTANLHTLKTPIIFAGDLNVRAESPVMRLFDGWLKDLTAEYEIADTLTQFGKVRNVPCDHILVSDEIKVLEFEVLEDLVSDHKPLLLEFEL
jgi:endonuclease/exonuclease/phosphatase family metal-dependent hydrolase